jgi:Tfp pilus assembly pilus retraction ATPase PilT
MHVDDLLTRTVKQEGSYRNLKTGTAPMLRVSSDLVALAGASSLQAIDLDPITQGDSQYGTHTFDQSISCFHESGSVSLDEALKSVSKMDEFQAQWQGSTSRAASTSGKRPESSDITRLSH